MAKEKNKGRVKWKIRSTRVNSEALSQKRKEQKSYTGRKKDFGWKEE
jgi:hypothetical protein